MTKIQKLKRPIRFYLTTAYTYERLTALLAHLQDGKFNYISCCCIRGAANADHALKGELELQDIWDSQHYKKSALLPRGLDAETATQRLLIKDCDEVDRPTRKKRLDRLLIAMVKAELRYRDRALAAAGRSSQSAKAEVYE